MSVRRATHAGSWYKSSGRVLSSELEEWLNNADSNHSPARAIIAPHAGFTYCGACGAHAYKQVDPTHIKRVFILGPSHRFALRGCALTQTTYYQTPLYNLRVDKEMNETLYATGGFDWMNIQTDEAEHSIEMHLPYIAKVMESKRDMFTIVPVLVGSLDWKNEQRYGRLFSQYLEDPQNLFIVSSDFCHWGHRFDYEFYDASYKSIHKSIEALDRMGMDLISSLDAHGFHDYLKKYSNTICGRHPIAVLLNAVEDIKLRRGGENGMSFKFLSYAQSNQCKSKGDSSVSYAAGALVFS
ncbi:protein MEMO1-like [Antedon mediterranea]|uniref:protein MEMO1-like n=1 Tax=Antedon mediterranea TaxID=105859 RepID=UPI003AF78B7B